MIKYYEKSINRGVGGIFQKDKGEVKRKYSYDFIDQL